VFAGIPFGAVGAFASLWLTGRPMGFLAILGITSLIGVIVSHVIVLFDFIEEQHERGAPLKDALIEAGIRRIRPVLITVGATVLALFPSLRSGLRCHSSRPSNHAPWLRRQTTARLPLSGLVRPRLRSR
jgi:multidrug efflux pump